jgi:hypothetical protein
MSGLFGRGHGVLVVAALVLAAAAGGTAAALTRSGPGHVASMPVAGRASATLEVTSGTPVLTIGVAKLGGALLRVSTPDYAPVRPVLSGSGPVVLSLDGTSPSGPAPKGGGYAVRVVLNSAVMWNLDLAGGTQRTAADLRGGRAGQITVTAGSDILDVTLPRPTGTTALRLAGGESQLLVSLPGGVPAQVIVGGGASLVTVDGQSLTGVAGGTVLTPPGWAGAASRFDIDATAGVSRLTVSRW